MSLRRLLLAALLLVVTAGRGRTFECPETTVDLEPFTTDPHFHVSDKGQWRFNLPAQGERFEARTMVHKHSTGSKDDCASMIDCRVEETLRGTRGPRGLELTHSWPAGHCPMVIVCEGRESHFDMPIEARSHTFRLEERDGATAQIIAPLPMQAGARYTLHLRPTVQTLIEALAACPVTDDLLARTTAAIGGHAPRIECHDAGGTTSPSGDTIKLKADLSRCRMLSELTQELSNAAEREAFNEVERTAKRGELDREHFIEQTEAVEFRGVRLRVRALEQCGQQWACLSGDLAPWQTATDFARYYDGLKRNKPEHVGYYGKRWDKAYKPFYQAKQREAHP